MLKMRKDGDIRDTKKSTNKNEMVERWKAESTILETVFDRDWRNRSTWHQWLPPLQWVWWTGFSAITLQWPQLRQKGQWAVHPSQMRHPHQFTLHHRAGIRRQHTLCSDFWVGRGLERHPVPPCCSPALCPCRGVACASAPQTHICYVSKWHF